MSNTPFVLRESPAVLINEESSKRYHAAVYAWAHRVGLDIDETEQMPVGQTPTLCTVPTQGYPSLDETADDFGD